MAKQSEHVIWEVPFKHQWFQLSKMFSSETEKIKKIVAFLDKYL